MQFFPWGGNAGDLGWEWIIHAERPGPSNPKHENFNYMGYVVLLCHTSSLIFRYSLEDQCKKYKYLADEQKTTEAPNSAWLYTKQLTCESCF
jgi:hypothetical protein